MTTQEERVERRRMLAALTLRATSTVDEVGSTTDVADLAAFADGSRELDQVSRARVMRVLAHDPAAWRVWRQARAAAADSRLALTKPGVAPSASSARDVAGSRARTSPWVDRIRQFLGIDLTYAVPVFASLLLLVAVGVRTLTDGQQSGPPTALAEIIRQQVPDLDAVRAGLVSAVQVAKTGRIVSKDLDAETDDGRTRGFDRGLRAAASALGVSNSAVATQPECIDSECLSFLSGGQTFGIWAFATLVRCAPEARADQLQISRSALPDLRRMHDSWLNHETLPLLLQAPPTESATDHEVCVYAQTIVRRVLK